MKKLSVALTAGLLALSLTGCGGGITTFDATAYIQGLLDETYLGKFSKDYMTMVGIDEEEAEATYRTSLEVEFQYLADAFEFDQSYLEEEVYEDALDLIGELYQNARYEVKPATKTESGFAVEVVIQPYDLVAVIYEDYMNEFSTSFHAKYDEYTPERLDTMSDAEYEAFFAEYENEWAKGVIQLFRDHSSEGGYLKAQSIIVQFTPDTDGLYSIGDNDFSNLDALILAYQR